VHRWDLQKKDPNATLSEPVEPITWWIENSTPVEWRETIKSAVLLKTAIGRLEKKEDVAAKPEDQAF
jgi:hypothetical protein